jgi:hypothetical protein
MFIDGVPRNKIASLLPQDDLALWLLSRISEKEIDPKWFALYLTHSDVSLLSDRILFK